MTKVIIRMNNSGGELERRTLHDVRDAESDVAAEATANILIAMIREAGLIYPGDSFTVEEG